MSFKGLAKRAKKQEVKPGEKQKCRKRFGKSIANKAPAMFVNILERKIIDNGGEFHRINNRPEIARIINKCLATVSIGLNSAKEQLKEAIA